MVCKMYTHNMYILIYHSFLGHIFEIFNTKWSEIYREFLLMICLIGVLEDPTFWGKVDDFGIIVT